MIIYKTVVVMEISIPEKTVFVLRLGPHINVKYLYAIMAVGCRTAYNNNEMMIVRDWN